MWKTFIQAALLAATGALAVGQTAPATAIDVANLKADIAELAGQVNQLTILVEQLRHDNAELKAKPAINAETFATVGQLKDSVDKLTLLVQSTDKASRDQVAAQLKKLAEQTNAALDALGKGQPKSPPVQASFPDFSGKEGISYTVVPGDTISGIAHKTGAKGQDIMDANKLTPAAAAKIQAGQKLFIPGGK